MPVLEARGESLYLVDRCAPCKGYRGTLLRPTSPYRWSLGPLPPSLEDLVCAPFYVRFSSRGTEPRQGETVPVDMFIISTSKPLQRFSSLDPPPLPPPPIAPLQANKIRGTKDPVNKLRGTHPTVTTFSLSRRGGDKDRFGHDNCATR